MVSYLKNIFKNNKNILFILVFGFVLLNFVGCIPYDNIEDVATSSTAIVDKNSIVIKEIVVHNGGEIISDSEYGYKRVKYSLDEFKDSCIELNYKDILRQPKNYLNEHIKFEGVIKSVKKLSVSSSNYIYEVETPMGICNITDNRLDTDIRLLKDDKIMIYGLFNDVKTEFEEDTNIISVESLNITAYIIDFMDENITEYKQDVESELNNE